MNLLITALLSYIIVVLRDLPKTLLDYIHFGFSYSILSCNRDMYRNVSNWILNLNCKSIKNNISAYYLYEYGNRKDFVSIGYGNYITRIDRFTYIRVTKQMIQNNMDSNDNLTISIFGLRYNKYKEDFLEYINIDEDNENISIFPTENVYDNYKIPKKYFNDIFNNNKQVIIRYLDNFLNKKDYYKEHGLIYKTGILLYGEPGTGKSTIARAIATYLNYDIHVLNLKSYEKDTDLIKRIVEIPQNSLVLLEDIDCILGNRTKELSEDERNLIGITLNMIDGVSSPNGVVFVATTNHIKNLDEAILRDGRFDLKLEITNIDQDTAIEMCEYWKCDLSVLKNESFPINPAYLQNKILNNSNIK